MLSTPAGGVQPLLYYCTNSPLTDDKLKRSQLTSLLCLVVLLCRKTKKFQKKIFWVAAPNFRILGEK